MSELTSVKTAIRRISSIFEEINGSTNDQIPKLAKFSPNLLSSVEKFENEKNANAKMIQTKNDEIESLKNKVSQNNREILNLEEENKNLTENRQDLEKKIEGITNNIRDLENQNETKKGELANREQRLQELEANVQQMTTDQENFEQEFKKLESSLMEEYDKKLKYANSFENRMKAMKLLIGKKYIKSPQVHLIGALQVGTELDLKNIIQAYDIKMEVASKILRKIVELGGPVEYNEAAGKVSLNAEVDFK
ncbi:hypothetical protein DSAG12_03037 [Promethearchaeum syntrophicum]|uniref:Uncharacterized protein n=1 Tax=Promethearchaeum syntrophicum TaxID=2594042 RepID=A0A5B9DDW9_9ARCH|nr:hypothetical protein [Candidatus Prometheoarchaeum syntrophicum]QEE17205.1 Chromosome partition protein Smc [Candidatus Prometheoarchaeum syntrophicum]